MRSFEKRALTRRERLPPQVLSFGRSFPAHCSVVPQFDTSAGFTKQNVDAFEEDVIKLQADFIKKYFDDIGGVLSSELSVFKGSFERNVPPEAKPATLFFASLVVIAFHLLYTFFTAFFAPSNPKPGP